MAPELNLGEKTVARLHRYLGAIHELIARGEHVISSWDIAHQVGVKPGLVRKDLSYLGRQLGTPSVGYEAEMLRRSILEIMGMTETQRCVWIGAAGLLAQPQDFEESACPVLECVGVFDEDPKIVGRAVSAGLNVQPMDELPQALRAQRISSAVIGANLRDPQAAADQVVRAGVRAILNLSPKPLRVPKGVTVHQADLATQLFTLAYTARL
jgi:redox-sensing transcriptional repressor